jgi:nucleoid-associated protein YgaU
MPNGDVVVAGWAEPGARVALLDGGDTLQEIRADTATGEFVFLPPRLGAGAHQLSLRSMTSSDGAQTKETTIQTFSISPQIKTSNAGNLAPSGAAVDQAEPRALGRGASSGKATIMRGDTLWRISRERLGRGSLFPTIYQANSTNIRDPNLIYPGQTLMMP